MKTKTDEKLIDEILSRSVVEILPSREMLKKELMSGRRLRIYIGTDATGPALHIGHATNYMILEKLRALGHEVIILIGDFTARIGDPTDKTAARVQLTRKQVKENTKTWLKQLTPILSFKDKKNPVKIVYNHDWLAKLNLEDIIDLAANFSVQKIMGRDMFEKRMQEEKTIYLHEFLYPLMQGYDSVHMNVDMEMCGNDQKFNALAGRTLLKRYKNKEKFVFITTLLENPVTKEKMMSKSLGTGVFLNTTSADMYGKIMAQPDENIPQLFTDCTFVELKEIEKMRGQLQDGKVHPVRELAQGNKSHAGDNTLSNGVNPRDIKMRLAFEIVKIYHGEAEAKKAQQNFEKLFSQKGVPDNLSVLKAPAGSTASEVVMLGGSLKSKGEAWRLIEQGGVELNGETLRDPRQKISKGGVLRIGKKGFYQLEMKSR